MNIKISKNHWILLGIIVLLLALYYFLVVRRKPQAPAGNNGNSPSNGGDSANSNYMSSCGQNEVGPCVGCIPAQCPPGSDTPGEQSQGCKCDGTGNCLPTCSATGGIVVFNGNSWQFIPRTLKRSRNAPIKTH